MRKKNIVLFVSVLLVLALCIGCNPQSLDTVKEGTLRISFGKDKGIGSLLAPSIDMDIASYELSGIGPEGRSFSGITSQGESVTISNLHMGSWTVTATGLNADGQGIGEGVAFVSIVPGRTANASIRVEEYTGEGTFSFTSDWPALDVHDPHLKLTFTKADTKDVQVFEAVTDAANGTALFSGKLAVGYYFLQVGLYEGASSDINNKLVGTSHAVRIVANNTTEGTYTVTQQDLNIAGNLSLQISNGIQNPFAVTLSKTAEQVGEGNDVTVSATTYPSVEGVYTWYLDGEPIENEVQDELVIGSDLSLGNHVIDVIVAASNVLSSASTTLRVAEYIAGYMDFVLTSLDDPSKTYELSATSGMKDGLVDMGFPQEGEGLPIASRLDSSSGNYNGTVFLASDYPLSMYGPSPSEVTFMVQMMIPQNAVGTYRTYIENEEIYGANLYFKDSSDHDNSKMFSNNQPAYYDISLTSYGPVGGMITGTIVADSLEVFYYGDNGGGEEVSLGNFRMEGSFCVKRSGDIVFYILSYDANGATSGTCPDNQEMLPMENWVAGNYGSDTEYDPLVKDGYTFGGWNTKADGTGITYTSDYDDEDESSRFVMPNEDTTLYALWIRDDASL